MAKKVTKESKAPPSRKKAPKADVPVPAEPLPVKAPAKGGGGGGGGGGRPSALVDTRVIYCGDCLEQLRTLPDGCVDLVYIDPPFNSNRNYEVFWGETKEKRAFEDRHASTQAYIDYMRPRCVELARVLKKTGSFYYHCDWHASYNGAGGLSMKYELNRWNRGATDGEILGDLQRVAGATPVRRLTLDLYARTGRFSTSMVQRRFGGWNKALQHAGLVPVKLNNIPDDSWFQNIALVWEHLGRQPFYSEMREPPSAYSPEGYANRFGGWRKALEAFVAYMGSQEEREEGPEIKAAEPSVSTRRGPRSANWRLRYLVMRRDQYRCRACGKSPAVEPGVVLEVDHILAWDSGGETVMENLQTLCLTCNGGKSNLDWEHPR